MARQDTAHRQCRGVVRLGTQAGSRALTKRKRGRVNVSAARIDIALQPFADRAMLESTESREAIQSAIFTDHPPRVISVHGATTQVGLTAKYLKHLEDSPPTVGKFLGIRRGKSLLIGM